MEHGQFSSTLKFEVPKADFLKMLHWYPFPAFYQKFLNFGSHNLFQTLLCNNPVYFMTCATLAAILFTKKDF